MEDIHISNINNLNKKILDFKKDGYKEFHVISDFDRTFTPAVVNGRIMTAIIMYKKNKISIGKASEMAGVHIGEFMDILSEFGISSNLTLEDYKESLENLKNIWTKKH